MNRSVEGAGDVAASRGVTAFVTVGALLAVVVTLARDPNVTSGAVAAMALGATVAVCYGILHYRPENPFAWQLCLAAVITGMVANALSVVTTSPGLVVLVDLVTVLSYTLFVAAGISALPRRHGRPDWVSQFDAITIATAGGIAIWYMWVGPTLREDLSAHSVAVGLVWPLFDLVLLVVGYRLATSGGPWRFPMTMIVAAMASRAVADMVYVSHGGARVGAWHDALLLVPMTSLGAAALHPQMRTFAADPHRTPQPITAAGMLSVSIATFAVPIVVAAHALQSGRLEAETPALLTAVSIQVVLGAFRSAEMVRQLGRARDELAHSATHDALTGLANRRLLLERLDDLFTDRRRSGAVLLLLDLDDFKTLNDTLGHQAGDLALVEVSKRISATLRPGTLVVRLGGDEFAVLLENADPHALTTVGDRLLAGISKPYVIGRTAVTLRASIGAARADHAASSDELISRADRAMYQAKTAGKNEFKVFDPDEQAPEPVGRTT